MDPFHSCYEDTSHDYCHFATLYLAVRFLNLLMASMFNFTLYVPAAALMFVFAITFIAKFQPYKYKRSNIVDIILLLTTINGFMSSSMYFAGRFMYPKLLGAIAIITYTLVIPCYLVFLILGSVFPKAIQCCKKYKFNILYQEE